MFTNDKKTLSKAIYVCLIVSSIVVTNDGYGMHPDEYRNLSSKKRKLPREFDNPAAKRKKTNPDQEVRNFNKQLKEAEKAVRPIAYTFEDIGDDWSKKVERNFITPITDLNKQVTGVEKAVRQISYACQDTYDNLSKTVERDFINPINDSILYDDTCSCTLF